MREPVREGNIIERSAYRENNLIKGLIAKERLLRKLAYKNTPIKTDDSFFDDSDMRSDYYLLIVYDRRSKTPLLSAR